MVTLRRGGTSDLRGGKVSHDDLLGQDEGGTIRSTRGERFLVIRPTMAEFILEMPRGAQVVYPKDLGAILIAADLFPGARVLEAGTGSGALTMALVRAVGPGGRVISYEIREEFARTAERNLQRFLGQTESLVLKRHDIYEGVMPEDLPLDRIILDIPEPWRAVPHASQALPSGGVFLAYLPTVPQVVETVDALRGSGTFALIETLEVLHRPWNIEGRSVRPMHRMVGHTGFLITARRVQRGEAMAVPESPDLAEVSDEPEDQGAGDGSA
jgi:tRNA (adenine57-N1/adenine58-N1)-methyltransferase